MSEYLPPTRGHRLRNAIVLILFLVGAGWALVTLTENQGTAYRTSSLSSATPSYQRATAVPARKRLARSTPQSATSSAGDFVAMIKPSAQTDVLDAFDELGVLASQASANQTVIHSDSWLTRWGDLWGIVFRGSTGELHDVATTCLLFADTQNPIDFINCGFQVQALTASD